MFVHGGPEKLGMVSGSDRKPAVFGTRNALKAMPHAATRFMSSDWLLPPHAVAGIGGTHALVGAGIEHAVHGQKLKTTIAKLPSGAETVRFSVTPPPGKHIGVHEVEPEPSELTV